MLEGRKPISYRSACRACGKSGLVKFLSLPDMPMTDWFLKSEKDRDGILAGIDLFVCPNCWLTQTQHDIDYAQYYVDYHYSAGHSNFVDRFMTLLAEWIKNRFFIDTRAPRVLEVGSGDGKQLGVFKRLGFEVLGFEPSSFLTDIAMDEGIPTLNDLFTSDAVRRINKEFLPVDVVLLTYTFDHIPDPVTALKAIKKILNPERGILVIENHDLEKIFQRNEYCLFEHEHSIYLTAATGQRLLDREGFALLEVNPIPEKKVRANSLIFAATPKESQLANQAIKKLPMGLYSDLNYYHSCAENIGSCIQRLDKHIIELKKRGKTVAGYGAGGRGVMTLAAMSHGNALKYVIDKNPKGKNVLMPKTRIPVVLPDVAFESPVDEIIVFSFGYFEEIAEAMMKGGYRYDQLVNMLEIIRA